MPIKEKTYKLTIEGEPVGKARARVVDGHSYTPAKTKAAEQNIAWLFLSQYPGQEVDAESSFELNCNFYVSDYKNGRKRKFDLDNGVKLVMDALTGIVWQDDNQVNTLLAHRIRVKSLPMTKIQIEIIEDMG